MKDPLKRITLVFALVALLPVAFLVYEFSQLNKQEEMVRQTFKSQLDAILFSVNQYSDDVLSGWANRIRQELIYLPDSAAVFSKRLQTIITQAAIVPYVYFTDLNGQSILIPVDGVTMSSGIQEQLDLASKQERPMLERLIQYEEAGFRKMNPLGQIDNYILVFFALGTNKSGYRMGALLLNEKTFITDNLSQKMLKTSQEKFVISVLRDRDDSVVYTTEPTANKADIQETARLFKGNMHLTKLWVLPDHYLGIALKGTSIEQLAADRTETTLALLAVFTLLLAGGLLFLYRNIRREMALSQAKSEFVSNVSHEIRTPLSLIGMFAETLEAGRVTTEAKKMEYYQIISKETRRLTRIVNRILNFSQLEANKKTFHKSPVQLNDLCAEVLANYADHLKEKGFEVIYKPGTLPEIEGDREAIAEVILNVVDNAAKYSQEHKQIVVETALNHDAALIRIRDKGIGIAREHHRDIFEQFFRAPLGDVHTTKGSGLGLTLVKKMMQAHGGDVQVESELGKGSTFTLQFPLNKKQKQNGA